MVIVNLPESKKGALSKKGDFKGEKRKKIRFFDEDKQGEIEEESLPNVNNGMPLIKFYDKLVGEQSGECPFFCLQFSESSIFKNREKKKMFRIDL